MHSTGVGSRNICSSDIRRFHLGLGPLLRGEKRGDDNRGVRHVPWPLELLNHLGRLNLHLCFIVVVVYVSLLLSFIFFFHSRETDHRFGDGEPAVRVRYDRVAVTHHELVMVLGTWV